MQEVNLPETLAANLKRELGARKISQTELARRCGVSIPRITEIMQAKYNPTLGTVERLATALDVAPTALLLPLPEIPVGAP
jgi:transcriptional regulator with XRE-family HTH domain